jgi:hypothetical protein
MAKADKRWLTRRSNMWFVVKHVPRPLWDKIVPDQKGAPAGQDDGHR